MKIRICAALLMALLILSGCSARAVESKLEQAEDAIEHKLDMAEEAVEEAIRGNVPQKPAAPQPPAAEPTVPVSTPTIPAQTSPAPAEAAKKLTPEEARAIALEHAGFTPEQVQFLRTEFDFDDGIPHYEVDFREGPWEYEYEIHAETGTILSFEKDD